MKQITFRKDPVKNYYQQASHGQMFLGSFLVIHLSVLVNEGSVKLDDIVTFSDGSTKTVKEIICH